MIFPLAGMSQDCSLKEEKDPYTKEIKISTGFITLNGAMVSIEATKTEIDFLFSINGKCFDDASTASIFFEGSKMKTNAKNTGTMNCDGLFHFNFKNAASTPSLLQNLVTKKTTSIHFKNDPKSDIAVTLVPEQQQKLMDLTACIVKRAKELLQ
jgi:hypothetical protein